MCLKQNRYSSIVQLFSFLHLRRSPDCPSLKKLSSLCESKVANTYVDKGSSNIAHKSFSAAVAKYFHIEFSKVLTFTSIFKRQLFLKNSVTHENVVCGFEQTIYKECSQSKFETHVQNNLLLKPGSNQNKLLEKSILKQKCASDKNQILSESV